MFSNVRVTNAQIEKMMSQASIHAVGFLLLACIWDMMGDGSWKPDVMVSCIRTLGPKNYCKLAADVHWLHVCNMLQPALQRIPVALSVKFATKKTGLNRTRLDYSFGIHGWHAQIQLQWMCVQDWNLRLCIISCVSYQLEVSWFWNGFELVSLAKKKNMVTRNFAIVGRFICLFLIILKILLLARLVET